MHNFRITYLMAPDSGPLKDLLIEAPSAEVAEQKAREYLRLRYPHHVIERVGEGPELSKDIEETYKRPAVSHRR